MPIYEYKCRGCDHKFSVLQRMGADEVIGIAQHSQ